MEQTVQPARLAQAQIRTILFGVVLAMLLGALDQTIVATALPTIGRELHDVQNLSWIVTAYLLTSTAVTPLYGKLSDIHGRRWAMMLAIAIFLGGSIACALSTNIYVLIAMRGLQGLGGGGLISLGQTIIGDVVPPRERGRYQAYFASIFVTASIAGPVLGGFFAEHLHWSFIFWINLPLGLAAYLLTNHVLKLLPRHERPHRIDVVGALLMVVATVALLLALSIGGDTGAWTSPAIIGLFLASLVFWGLFGLRLARAAEPFIPLSVLGHSVVRNGVLSAFFAVGAMIGLSVYLPLHFEAVLGLTASQSGLALIGFMGATVAGATTAGRIMVHVERYKRAAVVGMAIGTLALVMLAIWPTQLSLVGVEVVLVVAGLGLGTVYPISTTAVQNAVPPHQLGTTTGVLNFFRSLGSAILVATMGAVFLATAAARVPGGTSVQAVILQGGGEGVDFGPIFGAVFWTAAISSALGLVFMILMKELPLRGHNHPPAIEAG
ncbi:MAG: MFS transporter [Rhizobiales bacterium]|nr:MFS transporter [Hyphomicrobiales bacterium]